MHLINCQFFSCIAQQSFSLFSTQQYPTNFTPIQKHLPLFLPTILVLRPSRPQDYKLGYCKRKITKLAHILNFGGRTMRRLFLCLLLVVCMVVLRGSGAAAGKNIDAGVLDPCKAPGGPHAGCQPNPKAPPTPANDYSRGCNKYNRCRDKGN